MNIPDTSSTAKRSKWYSLVLTPLGFSSALALILANGLLGWYALDSLKKSQIEASSSVNLANQQPDSVTFESTLESIETAHNPTNQQSDQSALTATLLPAAVRLPELPTSIPQFEQLTASNKTQAQFYLFAPYQYDNLKPIASLELSTSPQIVILNGSAQIYLGAYTQASAQEMLEQLQQQQIAAYIHTDS